MMDVLAIRKQFPLFARRAAPFAYLDSAATTQKPQCVLDALVDFYSRRNSNIHRGAYALAEAATALYESARARLARFVGAAGAHEIVFQKNTTEAINLVAFAWGREHIGRGDEIVASVAEHHSNFVPWLELCRRSGARLRVVPLQGERVDANAFLSALSRKTKLVAIHHVSNVLGRAAPLREITEAARSVGARVLVDAAQSAGHLPLDVQALQCDFLAFSGHKMYGPTGIGVLYGRAELLSEMPPFSFGGGMIREVGETAATYAEPPRRFEAGTPPIAEAVALAAAADFLDGLGREHIAAHERDLAAYALARLQESEGVCIYGGRDMAERAGLVSFNLRGFHGHDVATLLDERGIAVRAGFHCAQPLMRALGVAATCRASFGVYTLREDIDRLADGLRYAHSVLGSVSS